MATELLVSRQNRDGGWSYIRGVSWTEPTVYATLALTSGGEATAAGRGLDWLRSQQRPDGGWAPQAGIEESGWVTALVALMPPGQLGTEAHRRAIDWLVRSEGEEFTRVYRIRQWLLGNPAAPGSEFAGWPWTQGAAAWVVPTSLAILALDKEQKRNPRPEILRRIEEGREYLLHRMCAGGGWNHGSVRALGYESSAYPETTGLALAAMRGVRGRQVDESIALARRFLAECRSADACNWLRLGLLAHGELPVGYCPPREVAWRTLIETSVDALVARAERGEDVFWSAA
ncbi:MAG: terpene cyclase/mutase family protein [Acidobacteria bacterium]|nr:terpene cyclase/mutase family protein [Acidobacteriota bacterium]